jgi:hypothetical protein
MKAANSRTQRYSQIVDEITARNRESMDRNKARDQEIDARNREINAHNRFAHCERARSNLGALKMQRPVFRYDNNGDRQYVEDANRQAEIEAAQGQVAANCD